MVDSIFFILIFVIIYLLEKKYLYTEEHYKNYIKNKKVYTLDDKLDYSLIYKIIKKAILLLKLVIFLLILINTFHLVIVH